MTKTDTKPFTTCSHMLKIGRIQGIENKSK